MNLQPGEHLGDYEVLELLGEGGMGQVYKVQNRLSRRIEAMKVVLPSYSSHPELTKRFMREIQVQASLDHRNIAALHTALTHEGRFLMVMEYVEGKTLGQLARQGRLSLSACLDFAEQALSALSYAHARGVIHRDIKPANMMLTLEGTLKLMDFGIAKVVSGEATKTGFTVGSLSYMSPEQIRGTTEPDARSDLYSLGITLYELVTGRKPFDEPSEYALMSAHLERIPAAPREVDPSLPPALSEIIMTALEKDPARRFQSADAFRAAIVSVKNEIEGLSEQPTSTAPASAPVAAGAVAGSQTPQIKAGNSARALYMLLGATAAIAVLVVGATQIPKFLSTAAHQSAQQEQLQPAPVPEQAAPPDSAAAVESAVPGAAAPATGAPATTASPESASATPAAAPQTSSPSPAPRQPERSATAPSAAPVRTTPSGRPAERPSETASQALPTGAKALEQVEAGSAAPSPVPTAARSLATPASQQVAAGGSSAPEPSATPPAPSAQTSDRAALSQLRNRLVDLATRANAVRSSLDTLERQQRAAGVGLRRDISTARQRMEIYLDDSEAALRDRDAEGAAEGLNKAEAELKRLETFLGR